MPITLSDRAVEWFKKELELPEGNKVLQFFVRYGGEFELKQGFSPAFNINHRDDVEIGEEKTISGLTYIIAEKDVWYFADDQLYVDVDKNDEITYSVQQ